MRRGPGCRGRLTHPWPGRDWGHLEPSERLSEGVRGETALLLVPQRELYPHLRSVRLLHDANQATRRLPANFPLSARQQPPPLQGVLAGPSHSTEN